jgi:hypothetical protein
MMTTMTMIKVWKSTLSSSQVDLMESEREVVPRQDQRETEVVVEPPLLSAGSEGSRFSSTCSYKTLGAHFIHSWEMNSSLRLVFSQSPPEPNSNFHRVPLLMKFIPYLLDSSPCHLGSACRETLLGGRERRRGFKQQQGILLQFLSKDIGSGANYHFLTKAAFAFAKDSSTD